MRKPSFELSMENQIAQEYRVTFNIATFNRGSTNLPDIYIVSQTSGSHVRFKKSKKH